MAPVAAVPVRLVRLSAEALDALAARDGHRFHAITGLAVGAEVEPPPLTDDDHDDEVGEVYVFTVERT